MGIDQVTFGGGESDDELDVLERVRYYWADYLVQFLAFEQAAHLVGHVDHWVKFGINLQALEVHDVYLLTRNEEVTNSLPQD